MAGHVGWSYDDGRDFDAYARSGRAAGLAQGEQVGNVPGDEHGRAADMPGLSHVRVETAG